MTAERPKPLSIRKKGSSQFWRNLLSRWPVVIWLGVALFALQLYRRGVEFQRFNGIVFSDTETVSPLEDGILKSVEVRIGDRVTPGQTVATMDDALIQAEIDDVKREYALERLERMLRFQSAYSGAMDELSKVLAEQKVNQDSTSLLEGRLTAMKQANAERPGTYVQAEVDAVELEYRTAKAFGDSYGDRVANLEGSRDSAKLQLDEILQLEKDATAEDSAALRLLQERLKATTLRANRAGTVATIVKKPGAVVRAGDPLFPVLTIVTDENKRVRAFILEEDAAKVGVGDPVIVVPTSDRTADHQGEVLSLAPQIVGKMDAASTVSNRMVQGREIEVSLSDAADLIPGQSVVIEVGDPKKFDWWSLGFRRSEGAR